MNYLEFILGYGLLEQGLFGHKSQSLKKKKNNNK